MLLTSERIRRRYSYSDRDIIEYCENLAGLASIVRDVPRVQIVRDPDDDMIIGCAIAASADYLVTRDKDLLSLGQHAAIHILTPEAFLQILREDEGR